MPSKIAVLALAAGSLVGANAARQIDILPGATLTEEYTKAVVTTSPSDVLKADGNVKDGFICEECINAFDSGINHLVNLAMSGVIGGTCAEICSYLPPSVPPSVDQVCSLGCMVLGEIEFMNVLGRADLDPFLFCDLIKFCGTTDGGAVSDVSVTCTPSDAHIGQTVDIEATYTVTKDIGAGQVGLEIEIPEYGGVGTAALHGVEKPGTYKSGFKLQLQNSEEMQFPPGVYNVTSVVCQGECGSKHKNSIIYGSGDSSFSVKR